MLIIIGALQCPLCCVFLSLAGAETLNQAFLLQFDVVLSCDLS